MKIPIRPLTALLLFLACALGERAPQPPPFAVLVFSRTAEYRHASIEPAVQAIRTMGMLRGFTVEAAEDPAAFTSQNLSRFSVIVFLSTTGDVLNDTQQAAMEGYIKTGGGFVGIHSAADTEYDWPWYGRLVGSYFDSHPAIQPGIVRTTTRMHPSTSQLGMVISRTDEWYNFRDQPAGVTLLMLLDETSYEGGNMGTFHPISWFQAYDGGRSWYTGMGHTESSWSEGAFLEHVVGGIRWASGVAE